MRKLNRRTQFIWGSSCLFCWSYGWKTGFDSGDFCFWGVAEGGEGPDGGVAGRTTAVGWGLRGVVRDHLPPFCTLGGRSLGGLEGKAFVFSERLLKIFVNGVRGRPRESDGRRRSACATFLRGVWCCWRVRRNGKAGSFCGKRRNLWSGWGFRGAGTAIIRSRCCFRISRGSWDWGSAFCLCQRFLADPQVCQVRSGRLSSLV